MSGHEAAALKAKVPRACCVCDRQTAEVLQTRQGRPVKFGKNLAGARVLRLRMLDGSLSEHSLCADCTPTGMDLAIIWDRAVRLYGEQASREQTERFARNIPIGIIGIAEDLREPIRIERRAR